MSKDGATATDATFLVVIDDTAESASALRYAAHRAKAAGGGVMLLHVMPKPEFLLSGGVQELMAAETEEAAQALLARKADEVFAIGGIRPALAVRRGEPTEQVAKAVEEDRSIRALVLGAAAKGAPGPLVSFFAGERAGNLPCVVVIVPGGLSDEAIDRLA